MRQMWEVANALLLDHVKVLLWTSQIRATLCTDGCTGGALNAPFTHLVFINRMCEQNGRRTTGCSLSSWRSLFTALRRGPWVCHSGLKRDIRMVLGGYLSHRHTNTHTSGPSTVKCQSLWPVCHKSPIRGHDHHVSQMRASGKKPHNQYTTSIQQ